MKKKYSSWTTGEDTILVTTMLNCNENRAVGYRKASKLLGRTPSACANRYGKERYKVVTSNLKTNGKAEVRIAEPKAREVRYVEALEVNKPSPTKEWITTNEIYPGDAIVEKPVKNKNVKLKEELNEELLELERLLTERISDLHEVKGGYQGRHAYMFYRKYVFNLQKLVRKIQ